MSMAPLFFRKAIAAFLVFDCTDRASFEALDTWFQQISNNIDSRVIIMMLGNKCDLVSREVSYNEAMEYARAKNMGYLEVSAKTGANIRNSFTCLVRGNLSYVNYFLETYKNTGFYEEPPKQLTAVVKKTTKNDMI